MCLFDSATCWRTGRKRCSPCTRSTVLWSAWIPTSGCSGPPWWPGGRSEDRVTASADAVSSFLTDKESVRLGLLDELHQRFDVVGKPYGPVHDLSPLGPRRARRASGKSYRGLGSRALVLSGPSSSPARPGPIDQGGAAGLRHGRHLSRV